MSKQGINALADVLAQTTDGRDIGDIWTEFNATLSLQNELRQPLIDFLTYQVTEPIADVASGGGGDFEEASEYGVPKGLRGPDVAQMGFPFKWYDQAIRYTWLFLTESSSAQVEALHNEMLESDNRLQFGLVMKALFNNANTLANIKGQNYNVYTFWNADGEVPPSYKNNTFSGSHTHFRSSGAATVTSGDLDEIADDFKSHGFGPQEGSIGLLLANAVEANVIRTFTRAGGARNDFLPAINSGVGLIVPAGGLLGGQVSDTFKGMNVIGSYGQMLIIEEDYIPAGYIVGLASGGRANIKNPLGIREHANPGYRGLRLVKGANPDYPLVDSYYQHGLGVGVRQRGAALVMKITAGAYSIPTQYA